MTDEEIREELNKEALRRQLESARSRDDYGTRFVPLLPRETWIHYGMGYHDPVFEEVFKNNHGCWDYFKYYFKKRS